MRIENRTVYETNALRRFITEAMRVAGTPVENRKRVRVRVVYSRGGVGRVSGRASLEGWWMDLRLPRPDRWGEDGLPGFAWIVAHEALHLEGKGHREFPEYLRWYLRRHPRTEKEFGWARGRILPLQEASPRKEKPGDEAKLEAARAGLKKATTRLKRAQSWAKRWQRRVRYYETRVAKAAGGTR